MSITALLPEPKPVDAAKIEAELRALRDQLAKQLEQPASSNGEASGTPAAAPNIIRASALNLLVYTEDKETSEQQTDMLVALSSSFPCRAFILHDDHEHPDENITAAVNAFYTKIATGLQICLEEVYLHAQSEARRRLSHTTLGALLPDLPVYMLSHAKAPWDNSTVPRLFRFASRMIVDSSTFSEPKKDLPDYAAMLNENKRRVAFSDLNWTRLAGWRTLMAQFFDATYSEGLLERVNRIFIKYDASRPNLGYTQALYLVSWLAVKLKWQFLGKLKEPEPNTFVIEMLQGGRRVECELLPATPESEVSVHGIQSFCLYAVERDSNTSFCLHRTAQASSLRTVATVKGQVYERTAQLPDTSIAELVRDELGIVGRDETFESVVELAARLSQGQSSTRSLQAATRLVEDSVEGIHRRAAGKFVALCREAISERGRFTVALSGGSTPRGLYELLASPEFSSKIHWDRVFVFFGDERCVPPDNERSNYRMASESLISKVPIPPSNIRRIYAEDPDKDAVARLYSNKIRELFKIRESELPVFDLILLGMGGDGHTASLFPGTGGTKETEKLVVANYVEKLKEFRITLTYPTINNAMNVMFLVAGADKGEAVKAIFGDAYHPDIYPAQAVQPTFGRTLWVMDKPAAALLDHAG